MSDPGPRATIREALSDDTLLVFISDTHLGGAPGTDIFASPGELTSLLVDLQRQEGPVELVFAGDFLDLLRMGEPVPDDDRIAATLARPEYADLFNALREFAKAPQHRVTYVVGNHDAEAWWNPEILRSLNDAGLVDEVALSYGARFASAPGQLVYCEHGNQFDPTNRITDYGNPLDTPIGAHVVTDLVRPIGSGTAVTESLDLREVSYVFPIREIPEWIGGRIFYQFLSQAIRWLITPLIVFGLVAALINRPDEGTQAVRRLLIAVAFDLALLVVAIGLLFLISRRMTKHAIVLMGTTSFGQVVTAGRYRPDDEIRELVEAHRSPPMGTNVDGSEIAVWVSGHTHSPSMSEVTHPDGRTTVIVNTGCWLRQLQPVNARLGAPRVFVPAFVHTHARVRANRGTLSVELWEHPRPIARRTRWIDPLRIIPKRPKAADGRLQWIERLAILGRMPVQPPEPPTPRVVANRDVAPRTPSVP